MEERNLRLDAIEFKSHSQARLNAKLRGLSDQEKMRGIKEIAENSVLGKWLKTTAPAPTFDDFSPSATTP